MFVSTHVRSSLFLYAIALAMTGGYCAVRLYNDNDYGIGSNDNEYQTFSYGGIAHAFLLLAIGIRATNILLADRMATLAELMSLAVAGVWSVSATIIYYVMDNATGPDWLDKFTQIYLFAIAIISCTAGIAVLFALPLSKSKPSPWVLSPMATVVTMISSGSLVAYILICGSIMLANMGDAVWSYSVFVIGIPALYAGCGIRNATQFDKRPWEAFTRSLFFGIALASAITALARNVAIHKHVKVGGFHVWLLDIGIIILTTSDAAIWALCATIATPEKKGSDDIPLLEEIE